MNQGLSNELPRAAASTRAEGKVTLKPLTSYRFLAAFAIVALHLGGLINLTDRSGSVLGFAVSFFYVLSGFILSYVHPRIETAYARKTFWIARFARIWPLHVFTLLAILVLIPFHYLVGSSRPLVTLPLNLVLMQSWVPIARVAISFNGVAWSLSVEAFFYFMFPFLVGAAARAPVLLLLVSLALRAGLCVLCLLFALPTMVQGRIDSFTLLSFFPPSRLYEFVLGLVVYRVWKSGLLQQASVRFLTAGELVSALGLAVLGLAWPALNEMVASSLGETVAIYLLPHLITVFFGLIILFAAESRGALSRLLSHPAAVFLGEISFSVYMTHQLIFAALHYQDVFINYPRAVTVPSYLLLILTVSALTWRYLELPARRALVQWLTPPRPTPPLVPSLP